MLVNLIGVSDVVDPMKQAYRYEVPIYDLIRLAELIRSAEGLSQQMS